MTAVIEPYLLVAGLYLISIAVVVVKLARYKPRVKIYGGFDYSYLEEQGVYMRAALAVAINTSLVSLTFSMIDKHTWLAAIVSFSFPLVSILLLKLPRRE